MIRRVNAAALGIDSRHDTTLPTPQVVMFCASRNRTLPEILSPFGQAVKRAGQALTEVVEQESATFAHLSSLISWCGAILGTLGRRPISWTGPRSAIGLDHGSARVNFAQ